MAKVSASKAKKMLTEGTARGKKITKKQKRYFGWVAGGSKTPKKPRGMRSK